MKGLTANQQHQLAQHQNSLSNQAQNKVNSQRVKQRRDPAQHLVSKQFTDTNVIPASDRVRGTRRHFDANNAVSNPLVTDSEPKAQIYVSRQPKPSAQLANFNEKQMELSAARGKKKIVQSMWSSDIFGDTPGPEVKYRKPVAFQEPVTDGLIRMDHGLKYREDPITRKIT